jgi:superfamily I DNA/RNA helicase
VLANREIGMTLKQQAVLFRTSSHSGALEVELTRRNIPFVKFGGLKFLDSAHVKDLLATLRFAQNPRDRVAGFRILQMLPGIGPQTAGKILDTIAADPEPLQSLAEIPPPSKTGEDWPAFIKLVSSLRKADGGWPGEMEIARLWYEPHLDRIHEDADTRKADLLQLEQIASGYLRKRSALESQASLCRIVVKARPKLDKENEETELTLSNRMARRSSMARKPSVMSLEQCARISSATMKEASCAFFVLIPRLTIARSR